MPVRLSICLSVSSCFQYVSVDMQQFSLGTSTNWKSRVEKGGGGGGSGGRGGGGGRESRNEFINTPNVPLTVTLGGT